MVVIDRNLLAMGQLFTDTYRNGNKVCSMTIKGNTQQIIRLYAKMFA